MVGFPNWPMGFPTKNDQHLGCEMVGFPSNLRKQPYGKYSPSFKNTVFNIIFLADARNFIGINP